MPFKCLSCGISFETAEEFIQHKRGHQEQPVKEAPRGLICLWCGKPIPVDSNYKGDVRCSACGKRMTVSMQGGEVVFAATNKGD